MDLLEGTQSGVLDKNHTEESKEKFGVGVSDQRTQIISGSDNEDKCNVQIGESATKETKSLEKNIERQYNQNCLFSCQ